ncbi:hypothetical protein TorRG33x02_008550, partial [Trema orientale]
CRSAPWPVPRRSSLWMSNFQATARRYLVSVAALLTLELSTTAFLPRVAISSF